MALLPSYTGCFMLSYQHDYHAGNHADILKHWILWECIEYLKLKPAPFTFIDTHAGSGIYDLTSSLAWKTAEYQTGVEPLMRDAPAEMTPFVDCLQPWLERREYPGSSAIAASLLRPADTLWSFEMHPHAFPALEKHLRGIRKQRTHVRREDGHAGLLRLLPTADRRALALIDPSYEIKTEYEQVIDTVTMAWRRMPNATITLWYPVLRRARVAALERGIRNKGITKVQLFELCISPEAEDRGMTGSGMIVVNPPWTLAAKAKTVLPELARTLSSEKSAHRIVELAPL